MDFMLKSPTVDCPQYQLIVSGVWEEGTGDLKGRLKSVQYTHTKHLILLDKDPKEGSKQRGFGGLCRGVITKYCH